MTRSFTRYAFIGLFLIGLIAIVYVLISASGGKTSSAPFEKYAKGEMAKLQFTSAGTPAPSDPFIGPNGDPITLEAYRGKTLLVNFWATWCPPCEEEMPSLGALQTARGSDTFEIIAISVDAHEDQSYAIQRLTELGAANLSFHFAPPEEPGKPGYYDVVYGTGTRGFPTSILYGPDGTEIARLAAGADWASIEAVNFIDAVIAQTKG
jgi:thiol-disulfide isomerase/thioredoxin